MREQVTVTDGSLVLPTYPEPPAEVLPMFAENRVHQRTSGNPYPNPVVLQVCREKKVEKSYRCITLENEYLKLEILPELGGRIYSALDKTTGYDFFYKQHVIKPALIGCLGSWISGGLEFNWPFHHRASTFMPVDVFVERTASQGVVVWLSEHDPIDRMKGMVGICLEPGQAIFETRMRLCNRTPLRHSFLWWENTAVPVNEAYQIFFPPDVSYVQFHYKRSITTYPVASNALGVYNGIRYPQDTDISMHKNTRQPTSYFCAPSQYDFFGGYDHGRQCGVVHVANHHISPGKKLFTWAYNQLATSWENALTDEDGAYAELMAGSYSDNQPDFSWLEPYETKCFSQFWFPVGALGVPTYANRQGALYWDDTVLRIQLTGSADVTITVTDGDTEIYSAACALRAGRVAEFPAGCAGAGSRVRVTAGERQLLDYTVQEKSLYNLPECTQDMPNFKTVGSAQELYLEGIHVQQYRDPAVEPDVYWEEALLRDPCHIPSLISLADYRYRQCRFDDASELAERAITVMTRYNKRPESGRLYQLLGLIRLAQHRADDAYDLFWKASWNMDTYSAAMVQIAAVEGRWHDYEAMAEHSAEALRYNGDHPLGGVYHALALWELGRTEEAQQEITLLIQKDPLHHLARYAAVLCGVMPADEFYAALHSDPAQTALDVYFDLAQAGFSEAGKAMLRGIAEPNLEICLLLGECHEAEPMAPAHAYPSRIEEYELLRQTTEEHPEFAEAQYRFGCLLYSKRQYERAADCFRRAVEEQPAMYAAYRNLAVAYYSHLNRREEALPLLEKALSLAPQEEQLVLETAYVRAKLGLPPEETAAFIRNHSMEMSRDDLFVELARAYNLAGQYEQALDVLHGHTFVPCEGGEHAVADQYMFAQHGIGRKLLAAGHLDAALEKFRAAKILPQNLGAGLWNEVKLIPHEFYEAQCLDGLGRRAEAEAVYQHILALKIDYFSEMHLKELAYYQAEALVRMGDFLSARAVMDAYQKKIRRGLEVTDPGYYDTTPFFLCYCDSSRTARAAVMHRLLGYFALFVGDDRAKEHFKRASQLNPIDLYPRLELRMLEINRP